MANPDSAAFANLPVPKLISNKKFKVRKDVLETHTEVINCSTVLPSAQDRILYFKVRKYSFHQLNFKYTSFRLNEHRNDVLI